jgi:predicted regulator of Ras-like GTPase activity (Roadblock/LC7/MglB family)
MSDDSSVSLNTVIERLSKRTGVTSVTLCKLDGLVIQTTLTDEEEARQLGQQFSGVVRAALSAYATLEYKEQPELVTVRSNKLEWVLSMADGVHGGPEKNECFFIVARDPLKLEKQA